MRAQQRCLTPDVLFTLEGLGKSLRVMQRDSGRVDAELTGHGSDIAAVCLAPDGGVAYTAGADGVRSWELDWEYVFGDEAQRSRKALAAPAKEFKVSRRAVTIGAWVAVALILAGAVLLSERAGRRAPVDAAMTFPAAPAPAVPAKGDAPPVPEPLGLKVAEHAAAAQDMHMAEVSYQEDFDNCEGWSVWRWSPAQFKFDASGGILDFSVSFMEHRGDDYARRSRDILIRLVHPSAI